MSKDDWFRLKTWTKEDKKNFFIRLNKSRSIYNKAQYLRIQALYLSEEYVLDAIELCELVIKEYPDPSEISMAYYTLAGCYLKLGNYNNAIQSFRKAFNAMRDYPNSLNSSFLDYAYWAVVNKKTDLYDEVLSILIEFDKILLFPKDFYLKYGIQAIIDYERGNITKAKLECKKAFEYANKISSGFKYHPNIGLVKEEEKEGYFFRMLSNIEMV